MNGEYIIEPFPVGPYDNPNNPKYILVNGIKTPIDTIGAHRPLPKLRQSMNEDFDPFNVTKTENSGMKPIPHILSNAWRKPKI